MNDHILVITTMEKFKEIGETWTLVEKLDSISSEEELQELMDRLRDFTMLSKKELLK